jgi:deazaflavin-dependent oxidoreductase (nitroreductase family)
MRSEMSGELTEALRDSNEVSLAVTGRVTGRQISNPVWFVQENGKIYLVPVSGSDSSWFKNVRAIPTVRLTANGASLTARAEPVTDGARVQDIVGKFRAKYGPDQIETYYSKPDGAVEVSVPA